MRVLLHPVGIAACAFVWFCWWMTKTATDILFFNVLFSDAWTANSSSSTNGSANVNFWLAHCGSVLKLLFECVTWLGLLSHLGTIFTDPGSTKTAPSVPPENFTGQKKYCAKCKNRWKPPRAHHCTVCNECIMKMDHHCPWVNNCIGSMNQKYFFLFLTYMALSCLINIGIIFLGIGRFVFASSELKKDFLSEQWEALETNSTLVETYRNTRGEKRSLWEHAVAVFGRHWWLWWLPIPPNIVPNWTDPEFEDEKPRHISNFRCEQQADEAFDDEKILHAAN